MAREKAEELADVPLIGLDSLRRHAPLRAEMGEPIDHGAGGLDGRTSERGVLSLAPIPLRTV
jgi:hypothetical protein